MKTAVRPGNKKKKLNNQNSSPKLPSDLLCDLEQVIKVSEIQFLTYKVELIRARIKVKIKQENRETTSNIAPVTDRQMLKKSNT